MELSNHEMVRRMREMASLLTARPLAYGLVMADIYRWNEMTDAEQASAYRRTVRRCSVVRQVSLAL